MVLQQAFFMKIMILLTPRIMLSSAQYHSVLNYLSFDNGEANLNLQPDLLEVNPSFRSREVSVFISGLAFSPSPSNRLIRVKHF